MRVRATGYLAINFRACSSKYRDTTLPQWVPCWSAYRFGNDERLRLYLAPVEDARALAAAVLNVERSLAVCE